VVTSHELTEGFGMGEQAPHSRLNGLDEGELAAKGYRTLTRALGAGVDIFVKEAGSLQVFLQGHPEYDGDTLAREYRRDVGRFLTGQRADIPALPTNYYSPELASRLLAWLSEAMQAPSADAAASFPVEAIACRDAPWRATSRKLYRNWLRTVANRKGAIEQISLAVARWGG
jgi:homoserine O-succinyltransferase